MKVAAEACMLQRRGVGKSERQVAGGVVGVGCVGAVGSWVVMRGAVVSIATRHVEFDRGDS